MPVPDRRDPPRLPRRSRDRAMDELKEEVLEREEQAFGSVKPGSAFFGWLAATGMSVILIGILTAAGMVFTLNAAIPAGEAADAATENAPTIGVVAGIVLMVVLFVAYYCGGYVAARMARFQGAKQGVAVWVCAALVAVVLALTAVIGGSQYDVLANLNSFPRIPLSSTDLAVGSIVTAIVAALVTLAGAVAGGMAGARYHRRIDDVGFSR